MVFASILTGCGTLTENKLKEHGIINSVNPEHYLKNGSLLIKTNRFEYTENQIALLMTYIDNNDNLCQQYLSEATITQISDDFTEYTTKISTYCGDYEKVSITTPFSPEPTITYKSTDVVAIPEFTSKDGVRTQRIELKKTQTVSP